MGSAQTKTAPQEKNNSSASDTTSTATSTATNTTTSTVTNTTTSTTSHTGVENYAPTDAKYSSSSLAENRKGKKSILTAGARQDLNSIMMDCDD